MRFGGNKGYCHAFGFCSVSFLWCFGEMEFSLHFFTLEPVQFENGFLLVLSAPQKEAEITSSIWAPLLTSITSSCHILPT